MKPNKSLLILLILPVIIIIISYGITKILNIGTGGGKGFSVDLDRDIRFPWEDQVSAAIHLDFTREKTDRALGKTNILLIMDNSSSMNENAGNITKFEAAKEAATNFIDNLSGGSGVRIGVIFFSEGITNQIPLTGDIPHLRQAVAAYTGSGEGTDYAPALALAAQWLENCRNEKNYIVFLTDGQADALEPNRIYREHLLINGVDIFMVGVGEDVWFHVLKDVISDENGNFDPNRILTCDDPIKLQVLFDQVGEEIGNVTGKQGEMKLPFAGKVFTWEKEVAPLLKKKYPEGRFIPPPRNRQNPVELPYPIIFTRQYLERMAVDPTACGIIKPFYDPLQFGFVDLQGNNKQVESIRSPYLLNITYAALFWLFLPALLYWLFSLLGQKQQEIPWAEKVIFSNKKLETPGVLPLQVVREKSNQEWIPTLVIGLGKTGRHVLTHLKQNLTDTIGRAGKDVHLLSIDVAALELDGPQPDRVPGTIARLDRDTEIYIPDPYLRNVKDKIEAHKNTTELNPLDPYSSLSLEDYASMPENILGLSCGSERQAALARTYLFKELEQGDNSKLLVLLREKLRQLHRHAASSDFMQVILVGNTNGGVGSGLIVPLTVLLQRWIDKVKNPEQSVEFNLILVEDRKSHHDPKNVPILNRVLLDELDLLSQAGRVSFPYHLVPPDADDKEGILRGMVIGRPYHNAYVFALETKQPVFDLFPQVSDSIFFFIERTARKESRNLVEGVKKQEGISRKKEKIEFFSHIAARSLIYPASLIKETLELLFINDIWSEKIALPGLILQGGIPVLEKRGTLEDLLEHPLSKSIMNMEMGRENNKWRALLLDQDPRYYNTSLSEDTENFWGFLEKAIPLLLNQGVFSLTGLLAVLQEIREKLGKVQFAAFQPQEVQDIQATSAFLEVLAHDLQEWIHLLLGTKDNLGLMGIIQARIGQIEILKKELLSMKKSRVVLGIDKDTPEIYNPEYLRKKWLGKWLNIEDHDQVYPGLKKRCLWKIVEKGVKKPALQFEFYGAKPYTFCISPDFQKDFMEKTRELSEQFLIHLKEITILELLLEYERKAPQTYSKAELAKSLYAGFETENLFFLYLLPHSSCIRLSAREETYIEELKNEIQKAMRVEEAAAYPPTSNQYRLFSLQVSTLLKGSPDDPWDTFKPLHMTEKLKQETRKMIENRFAIQVSPLRSLHYLVFYYPGYFKSFVNQWLGAKINKDDYDGLWKFQLDGQKVHLTEFPDEGIEEAALRYVMNFDRFALEPRDVTPAKERLDQLEEEVNQRNTIFCWIKLYMEKEQ